jgi:hypothetical protein
MIVDAPSGSTSSSIEENLGFWIDEAAKTLVLADGTPLTVRRLDDRWISAARGDMSYEFDRQNGNLTYASSTMKEGSATIIIGSGRCKIAVGPADRSQNPPVPMQRQVSAFAAAVVRRPNKPRQSGPRSQLSDTSMYRWTCSNPAGRKIAAAASADLMHGARADDVALGERVRDRVQKWSVARNGTSFAQS